MPAREQRSEVKGQKSETVREGFMKTERSCDFSAAESIKNLLKLVGAGLKRPPARKSGFAIGYGEKQNYGFITDTSCFHSAPCSGGRRDPPLQV